MYALISHNGKIMGVCTALTTYASVSHRSIARVSPGVRHVHHEDGEHVAHGLRVHRGRLQLRRRRRSQR